MYSKKKETFLTFTSGVGAFVFITLMALSMYTDNVIFNTLFDVVVQGGLIGALMAFFIISVFLPMKRMFFQKSK